MLVPAGFRRLLLNSDLDSHFTGVLEDQRQGKTLTGHQRLAKFEEHHMTTARLELHMPASWNFDRVDLLHSHDLAFMHMGVQLGFFRT